MSQAAQHTGTGCPTAATTVSYSYDGLDRQRSHNEGTGSTQVHYDGLGSAAIIETAPTTGVDTVYELDTRGQRKGLTQETLLSPTTQYLTDDGHLNLSTATTTAQAVACTVRFDPYGVAVGGQLGSAAQPNPCNTGSTLNDFFFRGGRRDGTTGQYQFGARTYDPAKASFMTPDVYRAESPGTNVGVGADPLTANRYVYVNGDPINLADPTGHAGMMCDGQACGWTPPGSSRSGPPPAPQSSTRDWHPPSPQEAFLNAVCGSPATCDQALNALLHPPAGPAPTWPILNGPMPTLAELQSVSSWMNPPHHCGQSLSDMLYYYACKPAPPQAAPPTPPCDTFWGCLGQLKSFFGEHKLDVALNVGTLAIQFVPGVDVFADAALGLRLGTEGVGAATEASSALVDASSAAFKAADNAGTFSVPLKHLFGSAGRWAKFGDGVDANSAIEEALRSEGAVFSPNNIDGAFRVTTDLGRAIGSSGQTGIRVVVGDDGSIWTAFPVNP